MGCRQRRSLHVSRLRVVVVDDSPLMRYVVSSWLTGDSRLKVVQEFGTAGDVVSAVEAACPDVIVIDNEMPGGDGVDVLPLLRAACPQARIVMFSSDDSVQGLALSRGADSFVSKLQSLDELLAAVLPAGSGGHG